MTMALLVAERWSAAERIIFRGKKYAYTLPEVLVGEPDCRRCPLFLESVHHKGSQAEAAEIESEKTENSLHRLREDFFYV